MNGNYGTEGSMSDETSMALSCTLAMAVLCIEHTPSLFINIIFVQYS